MIILEVIFWLCGILVVYSYLGYTILLRVLPATQSGESKDGAPPTVTMIIAAYNEEAFIRRKIENALLVDYHPEFYKVVVVSDGSSDSTNAIAGEFCDSRLTVLELQKRGGKANAINHALRIINSDILVFTDANVFLEPEAVSKLVNTLSDDKVGAVTGMVSLEALGDREPLGEGAYMRYERYIQSLESRFWSVAGVDGALFAVKRRMVTELPPDTILDDFTIGTRVSLAGMRVKYQPEARAVEQVPAEVSQEFRRKSRIAAGNFQFLSRLRSTAFFASPFRFRFSFVSHKILRWYVPFVLIAAFITNLALINDPLYRILFVIQTIPYGLAATAHFVPQLRRLTLAYVAYYFFAMNAALLVGWYRHKRGSQTVTWKRVDR